MRVFLIGSAAVLLAVEFLKIIGSTGIVILAAILVAYLILPIVDRLHRRLPLAGALALTYLLIAAVLTLAVVLIVPPLVAQAHALILSLPASLHALQAKMADPGNSAFRKIPPELRDYINGLPAQLNAMIATYGLGVAQRTLSVVFSAFSIFLSVIIVPILAAYLLFDTGEAKRAFIGFIPPAARPKTLAILGDVNAVIGAFVRGQVLDGIILAAMVTLMLWIMHVPYALLIGVAAGFLNLVPYLGAIIGFIPSILLALLYNGWQNALIVGLLFAVIQQVDGNVILPRIMKQNVLLSPLVVIMSILVFTALFGILGTFLAVPVAAMLRVLKLHFAPAPSIQQMRSGESAAQDLTVFEHA